MQYDNLHKSFLYIIYKHTSHKLTRGAKHLLWRMIEAARYTVLLHVTNQTMVNVWFQEHMQEHVFIDNNAAGL